jgi:hypothetical protein
MEVIARLQDRALCAEMSGSEIPVRSLSRQPDVAINRVQAGRTRRLGVGGLPQRRRHPARHCPARFGAVVCLYVLIHLPAGMLSCVAERVTQPVRNREARVTEPYVAWRSWVAPPSPKGDKACKRT